MDKITETQALFIPRLVGLDPDDKKPLCKYSLGMKQRLGIAQATMENPSVLILDEPFHSVADIERACDVVYEMKNGGLKLI